MTENRLSKQEVKLAGGKWACLVYEKYVLMPAGVPCIITN